MKDNFIKFTTGKLCKKIFYINLNNVSYITVENKNYFCIELNDGTILELCDVYDVHIL